MYVHSSIRNAGVPAISSTFAISTFVAAETPIVPSEVVKLVASDGATGDYFGNSVFIFMHESAAVISMKEITL